MSVIKLVHFKIHTRVQSSGHRSEAFGPLIEHQPKVPKKPYFGAHGEEEIPVTIPNTEVKLLSGDYTAQVGN